MRSGGIEDRFPAAGRPERKGRPDCERLLPLVGHIQRTLSISGMLEQRSLETEDLEDLVNRIAPATIIVDRGRRILRTNAEGASQLKRGEIVEAVGGRVQMCLGGLQVEMDRALKDGNETPIILPLGAIVNRHTAIGIVPIKRHSNGERRFAMVFQEARASSPFAMEIWSKTYSLTGGELRVLHGLVLGSEPREIAESYGIALSTVRTHLLSLFRKTGARRLSDLIRLALELVPPVSQAGPPP